MPGTHQPSPEREARDAVACGWVMAVLTAGDRGALGYRVAFAKTPMETSASPFIAIAIALLAVAVSLSVVAVAIRSQKRRATSSDGSASDTGTRAADDAPGDSGGSDGGDGGGGD